MGEDKALLPFATFNTLTEYQFHRLSQIFHNVYISAKSKKKFPLHLQEYVIEDVESSVSAPSVGFVSIFKALKEKEFFVLSVDTPFVSKNEIEKILAEQCNDCDAIIAQSEKKHFMCALYRRTLQSKFEQMLESDNHSLGALLKESKVKYIYFEDEEIFMNLNYKDEYEKAVVRLSGKLK